MIHTLTPIALSHFLPYKPRHHTLYPLLSNYCVLGGFESFVIIVVYAVEGRWDCGFGGFEGGGFGGRHCDLASWAVGGDGLRGW